MGDDYIVTTNSYRQNVVEFSRYRSAGIRLTINKSQRCIDVDGWFDDIAGIEGGRIMLDDLLALFEVRHG